MNELFNRCLAVVLKNEGGYSNHPSDPGGSTQAGVTQKVYNDYRTKKGLENQSVIVISDEEIHDIYLTAYWTPMNLEGIKDENLILELFDTGVNCGIRTAIKMVQRIVGTKDDGIIGNKTISLINEYPDLVPIYKQAREAYYYRLVERNPKLAVFVKGWINRITNTHF
jgi:lysozyme family protein